MACTQTLSNINTDCTSIMGGLDVVYAINRVDIDSITLTDGKITAITTVNHGTSTDPDPAKFYTYAFRKQSSSMTSTYTIDDTAGTKYVTTELALRFAKMDTAKRVSFMALANSELALIVKTANGEYFYLGYDRPVTITAGTGESGASYTDANQYTVTLSDMSNEMPYEVSASIVSDLVA